MSGLGNLRKGKSAWDNTSNDRKKERSGTENSAEMGHRGTVYLIKLSFGINHSSVQQLFYFPEVLVVMSRKFSS